MAAHRVAPHQKRAKRERARIVFIDESGMMMAPLVRRTLAPAGKTPVLRQKASHRDRVSLIAALSISQRSQQVALHFRTHPKGYVNNVRAAEFLRELLRQVRGPVIVVWDRGNMHRGDPIRELEQRFPRLRLEQFPPYAPELNPVEQLWDHCKYHKFCNYAPRDVAELDTTVTSHLKRVQRTTTRIRSFFAAAHLPFP